MFRLLQQVIYKLVPPVPSLITELLLQNVDAIPHQVVQCNAVVCTAVQPCQPSSAVQPCRVQYSRVNNSVQYSLVHRLLQSSRVQYSRVRWTLWTLSTAQGCCCIDEFDKMSGQHAALLVAVEQHAVRERAQGRGGVQLAGQDRHPRRGQSHGQPLQQSQNCGREPEDWPNVPVCRLCRRVWRDLAGWPRLRRRRWPRCAGPSACCRPQRRRQLTLHGGPRTLILWLKR